MKVAIVASFGEQRGGGGKRLWDLLLNGRDRGIQWLVIFQVDGPLVKRVRQLGVPVYLAESGRLRNPVSYIKCVKKISSIIRKERADVVLSWMWITHFYGYPASLLTGTKSIWSQIEIPNDTIFKQIVTKLPAQGIFVNSKWGMNILRQMVPNKRIVLVYPGVDLDIFDESILSKSEARKELKLPETAPLIGIVGRLRRMKGMHILVSAMPNVLLQYPAAQCFVIGGAEIAEPEYKKYLENLIDNKKLNNHAHLVGLQKNVATWMQAMDIMVQASDHTEAFGITVVEAMALEKPIIATAGGGPTEIVTNGVDGILVEFEDTVGLSRAITNCLGNPKMASELGKRAKARAQEFSTRKYTDNFISGLQFLLDA